VRYDGGVLLHLLLLLLLPLLLPQYMIKPWLQYEAYGIRVTNNIVYNTWGAGLGVAGGYNVLMAYNTVYRWGCAQHSSCRCQCVQCGVNFCTHCHIL
jgi:hypothetical protein